MNDPVISVLPGAAGGVEDGALPFSAHLAELRKSILISLAAVAAASLAAYGFVDPVMRHIAHPVGRLYFLSPAEALMTKLKLALFSGGILGAPVVFYEGWSFVRRGLYPGERKTIVLLTGISLLLFLSGAAFCYLLVLPVSVRFLMGCGSDVLVPFISASSYLSFVCRMVVSFGIAFELPLALWFLVTAGLVTSSTLRRNRRLAIVLAFLAAAVLTPTCDMVNQALMAVPLVALFEAGIVAARIAEKTRGGPHG